MRNNLTHQRSRNIGSVISLGGARYATLELKLSAARQ